jgi:hypothetical protein
LGRACQAIGAFTGQRAIPSQQQLHVHIWDRYVVEQAGASYITRVGGVPLADDKISEQVSLGFLFESVSWSF